MTLYTNPDFKRLPMNRFHLFHAGLRQLFAISAWYDLMSRHGMASGNGNPALYSWKPRSRYCGLAPGPSSERRLISLVYPYGVEHGT